MCSSVPAYPTIYNSFGRIIGPGSPPNLKYGAMNPDASSSNANYPYTSHYLIDFSNFPIPPEYVRILSNEISILDLITQICTEGGYSYYIELLPIRYNGQIYKVIKPRLISKLYLGQNPNTINTFLSANPLATAKTYGKEFRNEPTSSLIVGANQEGVMQSTTIRRYFGLDGNGNIRTGGTEVGSSGTSYPYYIWDISKDLPGFNTVFIKIYLWEMEAAAHSQDSFEAVTYKIWQDVGPTAQNFGFYFNQVSPDWKASFSFDKLDALFADFKDGKTVPLKKGWDISKESNYFEMVFGLRKTLEGAFNYVSDIANTYCGKQFIVPLPYSVSQQEQVQGVVNNTETPCESGWSEEDYILGLNRTLTTLFSDDNSKVRPFALLDANNNETYNTENYLIYESAGPIRDTITRVNTTAPTRQQYVTCGIDSQLVYTNAFSLIGPHVVIVFENPIRKTSIDGNLILARNYLITKGFSISDVDQFIVKMQGADYTNLGIQPINGIPLAIAIPLRNNYITYGPWVYTGAPGNTVTEVDQTLAPWEYGGTDLMNLAGQNKANSIAVNTQTVETGSITLPGYPEKGLGSELLSNAASTIETRNILINNSTGFSTNKKYLNVNAGKWTGLLGPNITNISCEIGEQGITTTYEMRSYTAVYGRFNRALFDRIKLLGQQDQRIRRQQILNRLDFKFTFDKQTDYVKHSVARMASGLTPLTFAAFDALRRSKCPVNVMSGNIYNDATAEGSQEHADVGINKSNSILNEMHSSGYAGKAMMSLDGLFRPVSRNGDGGFPKFNSEVTSDATKITVSDLDPFQSGHDIEILARGATPPSGGKSLYLEGNYADDYRFLAHRGPMVLTGWGYDTNGKPIPNQMDTEAQNGKFKSTGLTDSFRSDYLSNSRAWATGPVDLRYDRDRGVWTAPTSSKSFRMFIVEITEEDNNNKKQRDGQGLDFSGDPPNKWYGEGEDIYTLEFDPKEAKKRKYRAKMITSSLPESADGSTPAGGLIDVYTIDKRMVLDKYDRCLVYLDPVENKYYVVEHFADKKIYYGKVVSHGLNCVNDLNVAIADVIPYTDDFAKPQVGVAEETADEQQVARGKIKVHFFNVRAFSFPFTLNQKIAFAKVNGIFVAIGDYSTPFRFAIGRIIGAASVTASQESGFLVQYSMNAPNEAFPLGASKGPFGGSFGEVPATGIGTQVGANNPTGLGYTPINLIGFAHNTMHHPLYLGQLVFLYLDESCIPEVYSGVGGSTVDPPSALFFILRAYHNPLCILTDISIQGGGGGNQNGCGGGGVTITVKPTTIYLDTAWFDGQNGFANISASSRVCNDVEYECCSSRNANNQNQRKKISKGSFQVGTNLSVYGQAPQCFYPQ